MAEITNAEVVRQIKEGCRPMAERLRDLIRDYNTYKTHKDLSGGWGSVLGAGANGDTVAENRLATEGVSDLTVFQINQFHGVMDTVAASNSQIVAAPCVRVL